MIKLISLPLLDLAIAAILILFLKVCKIKKGKSGRVVNILKMMDSFLYFAFFCMVMGPILEETVFRILPLLFVYKCNLLFLFWPIGVFISVVFGLGHDRSLSNIPHIASGIFYWWICDAFTPFFAIWCHSVMNGVAVSILGIYLYRNKLSFKEFVEKYEKNCTNL